jgi:hypothetical protein
MSPAPSAPEDYSHFGQAGIFVEFTGSVAFLVHYGALNTPLSPDPPPRWERCDGKGQRYRRQRWSNAALAYGAVSGRDHETDGAKGAFLKFLSFGPNRLIGPLNRLAQRPAAWNL